MTCKRVVCVVIFNLNIFQRIKNSLSSIPPPSNWDNQIKNDLWAALGLFRNSPELSACISVKAFTTKNSHEISSSSVEIKLLLVLFGRWSGEELDLTVGVVGYAHSQTIVQPAEAICS